MTCFKETGVCSKLTVLPAGILPQTLYLDRLIWPRHVHVAECDINKRRHPLLFITPEGGDDGERGKCRQQSTTVVDCDNTRCVQRDGRLGVRPRCTGPLA